MLTTQKQVRAAFWEAHPQLPCTIGPRGRILPQNDQHPDTRCAFVDFVDALSKSGEISEALARRVTL